MTSCKGGGDEVVHVLVVADDPNGGRLADETARRDDVDADVHVANDRRGALAYLERRDDRTGAPYPGLVLIDLDLPDGDGEAVLRTITDDPDLANIPVVVLSGSAAEAEGRREYELRANAFLPKPFDPDEFAATIGSLRTFWLDTDTLPPAEGGVR